ncbi:hypothetical protein ACWGVR_12685 [Streptomyces xanthophaeus]
MDQAEEAALKHRRAAGPVGNDVQNDLGRSRASSADTLCRGGVIWHQGNLETMVIDGFQDPTT